MDHARSSDPAVQTQLDRLWALSPGADVLGLERITCLLAALDNPHHQLPPVFHVAGTNGKGSTCAFLRAGLEATGYRVHAYTSPHLVRFNERIRLAGGLIEDCVLAPLLAEVLDTAEAVGISASFFEVTTAAAFLAFARTPADACVIEVGLGGRLDATNVVAAPAVTGIAQLGIDHQAFLGDTAVAIAREKAGITKAGVPLVTMAYTSDITAAVAECADRVGAPVMAAGEAWRWQRDGERLLYHDATGTVETPLPAMIGAHQHANCALAIAMLRHQRTLEISEAALAAMPGAARWPARMQRLGDGPLTRLLAAGTPIWLDGGHNAAAGEALAAALAQAVEGTAAPRIAIIAGMLANKDPAGLLAPLAGFAERLIAVPVPDHDHHDPASLAALAMTLGIRESGIAPDIASALAALAPAAPDAVLICGSLYLAGEVLAANEEWPD